VSSTCPTAFPAIGNHAASANACLTHSRKLDVCLSNSLGVVWVLRFGRTFRPRSCLGGCGFGAWCCVLYCNIPRKATAKSKARGRTGSFLMDINKGADHWVHSIGIEFIRDLLEEMKAYARLIPTRLPTFPRFPRANISVLASAGSTPGATTQQATRLAIPIATRTGP
jgi:hypothetical protein